MDDFFTSPQGAAILKHKLLATYLGVFTGKLGSTARGGRVAFIDGYAGPGRYLDDSPGSPQLAVETAERLSGVRSLECYFVEPDRGHFERLEVLLADHENCVAVCGTAEDELEGLVGAAGEAPLLVFLDPYGLTIPFDQLVELVLTRPDRRGMYAAERATEVVFNFSISAVRRFGGWLDKEYDDEKTLKQQASILEKLDQFFGGDWWREVRRRRGEDWVDRVLEEYLERLLSAAGGGWGYYVADVSDRYGGPPAYHLVLLSQHPDGLWHFNEGASLGVDALREHTLAGQTEIFDPEERKAELATTIAANIDDLVSEKGSVQLNRFAGRVYGRALAEARSMHVRAALKLLYADGRLRDTPVGVRDIGRYVARRPS